MPQCMNYFRQLRQSNELTGLLSVLPFSYQHGCLLDKVLLGKCPEPRREGSTPLIVAARAGQLPAMALLLEKKANVDTRNASGDAALHVAIQSAVEKLAELKSAQIKSGDAKTSNNSVPSLSQKAESAVLDTEATAFLIDHKASVNAPDGNGRPPLHVAVFSNDEAIIGYLLEVKVWPGDTVACLTMASGLAYAMTCCSGLCRRQMRTAWIPTTLPRCMLLPLMGMLLSPRRCLTTTCVVVSWTLASPRITLFDMNATWCVQANPDSVDADGATPLFYASASK